MSDHPHIAVCIPLGPGHGGASNIDRLRESVRASGIPHATIHLYDDATGEGRSRARNRLAQDAAEAGASWILWLDADDELIPGSLDDVGDLLVPEVDAVWGAITSNGALRPRQQYPDTYKELVEIDPYLSLQIGFFVRTDLATKIPWDESKDAGEDFKMYLELWRNHKCRKARKSWYNNITGNHSKGPRSASGRQWRNAVEYQLFRARESMSR